MINYKLDDEVKKLCLERIGEVEGKLSPYGNTSFIATAPAAQIPKGSHYPLSQAQMADLAQTAQIQSSAPKTPYNSPVEVVTGGGNGTSIRGPSKFKRHAVT